MSEPLSENFFKQLEETGYGARLAVDEIHRLRIDLEQANRERDEAVKAVNTQTELINHAAADIHRIGKERDKAQAKCAELMRAGDLLTKEWSDQTLANWDTAKLGNPGQARDRLAALELVREAASKSHGEHGLRCICELCQALAAVPKEK